MWWAGRQAGEVDEESPLGVVFRLEQAQVASVRVGRGAVEADGQIAGGDARIALHHPEEAGDQFVGAVS